MATDMQSQSEARWVVSPLGGVPNYRCSMQSNSDKSTSNCYCQGQAALEYRTTPMRLSGYQCVGMQMGMHNQALLNSTQKANQAFQRNSTQPAHDRNGWRGVLTRATAVWTTPNNALQSRGCHGVSALQTDPQTL